jgi:hypothetical protein
MDGIARPEFFEGQYIGADDLQSIVAYARARHNEHLLAGHGWGIAAGLELVEQANPDGSINVWLQPGYAWDGYGRSILVSTPTPVSLDQLTGKPGGAWFVWLSYSETQQDATRASYGVCEGTDRFLRIGEGFQLVISGQLRLDQQQSGVLEAGTLRADARLARRLFDPDGPFLCDANVPEQAKHPLGGQAIWLVPAGLVGWDSAAQRLRPLSTDEKNGARLFRRHVGTVAEDIFAPGGLLRLRRHGNYPASGTPDSAVNTTCSATQPVATDLVTENNRVSFSDLVWIEGNLRALGHARLYGTRLELRAAAGAEPDGPFFIRRNPTPAAAQSLDVALGAPPAPNAVNQLTVGALRDIAAPAPELVPALIVRADGRTQVGTAAGVPQPQLALDVKGDFGREDAPVAIHLMGSRIADGGDGTLLLTSGGTVISLGGDDTSNDQVGIRTKAPAADLVLDVHGPIGVTTAPAFLRLLGSQFRDHGDGILRIRSGGAVVSFDSGNFVGIGTTQPRRVLHTEVAAAGEIHSGGGAGGFSFADRTGPGFIESPGNGERWVWYAQGTTARLWSGIDKVVVTSGGRVGIGTGAPTAALEVNGDARVAGNLTAGATVNTGSLNVGGGAAIGGNLHVNGSLTLDGFFNWLLSDARLKRDIAPLTGALDTLLALRGVEFRWAREDLAGLQPGRQVGLIADEVEKVLPQWVSTGEDGNKRLNFQGFEALVIEALRKLSDRVGALEAENRASREALAETVAAPRQASEAPRRRRRSSSKSGK